MGGGSAPGPLTPTCPPHSQPKMTEYDKRCCCLREIQQTEEKYTDTLGSIQQVRLPGSDPAPGRHMRESWAGRCSSTGAVASGPCLRGPRCPKAWGSSPSPLLCVSSSLFLSAFLFHPVPCVDLSLFPSGSLLTSSAVFLSLCVSLYPCLYLFLYPRPVCLSRLRLSDLLFPSFWSLLFQQLY